MRISLLFVSAAMITALTSFRGTTTLTVTSPAFQPNTMMPQKYSCEAQGTNPPLNVTNIPEGVKSLALIVHDPDAPKKGGFTHWVIWNMSTDGNIPESYTGADQGLNSAQEHEFKGACPPSGTHRYFFMVYALDTKLDIDKNTDKAALEKAMRGHILGKGELVGLYKRAKEDREH